MTEVSCLMTLFNARYVQNLRRAFPVREMWSPVESVDAEKSFVPFVGLVVEVRDSL
jgi:hypothetical protein